MRSGSISRLVLSTVLSITVLVGSGATGAFASAAPLPQNCAEAKAQNPAAGDGTYTLSIQGVAVELYCHDMAGTPGEYLTLPNTGGNANYSMFYGHHMDHRYRWYLIQGTHAITHYTKIRINPVTLVVDRNDQAFTIRTSVGVSGYDWSNPSFKPVPQSMPYAAAADCYNMGSAQGKANLDLSGTLFAVDPSVTFTPGGWAQNGSTSISPDRQTVDLTGGGWCGGNGPDGDLKLQLLATPVIDATAPVIEGTVAGTEGANGWYTSDVSVSWSVTDAESAITAQEGCDPVVLTEDTAGETVTCSATSAGGTSSESLNVKRDTAAPTVTFTGNAGTYTVDQEISISCAAQDSLSGVAADTCSDIVGPAYSFVWGTNEVTASATDNAGNVGDGTATFEVQVTTEGISALITQFVAQKGVANALIVKLNDLQQGNPEAVAGKLAAFVNHVQAQTGKQLTPEQADLLIRLVGSL